MHVEFNVIKKEDSSVRHMLKYPLFASNLEYIVELGKLCVFFF